MYLRIYVCDEKKCHIKLQILPFLISCYELRKSKV